MASGGQANARNVVGDRLEIGRPALAGSHPATEDDQVVGMQCQGLLPLFQMLGSLRQDQRRAVLGRKALISH